MHILFILEHFKPYIGGAEVLFDNVVQGLVQQGHQVVVLTSRFNKNLPKYQKTEHGVEIYRVGHNRYDFMLYALGEKGKNLAKNTDIIHTTTYNAAIPAKILSKVYNKKIVITVHEIFGKSWMKFMGLIGIFFRLYENIILTLSYDKIICVSNTTKDSLIKWGIKNNNMVTIYNGIDYEIWNKDRVDVQKVIDMREDYKLTHHISGLFFGRPGISKGLEYYIRAIPMIIKDIPNFKAVLLVSKNDIQRYTYIKNIAKKLGIQDYIIRLDSIPYTELINYIAATNFTIIPSLAEGFGFAAVEASTIANCIIVTTAGSLPEVISDNVVFVEPGNSIDIARGVKDVYENKYDIIPQKLFLWSDNIQKTLDTYRHVLGE